MREGTCLHCGAVFTQEGRGRNRAWCFDCLQASDGSKGYALQAVYLADFKKTGEHGRCCGKRRCMSCHETYMPWCTWDHPGPAGCRCHSCYLAYTRGAQRRRLGLNARPPRTRTEPKALGFVRSKAFKAQCAEANLPCALCGEPIDYLLEHPSRESFSVDHIIPTSQGGAVVDPSNLQPSHLSCNARRGRLEQGEPLLLARAALWLRDAMQEATHDRHARAQG